MKYKTFITLVISAAVLAGGGLLYLIVGAVERSNAEREQQARDRLARERAIREHPERAVPAQDDLEPEIRGFLGQPASSDKIKDLNEGRGPKINIYAENGVWTRAKVDRDRDEKWDEKWRWENGTVYRKVAALDDEVYGLELVVGGGGSASPSPSVPTPSSKPAEAGAPDELRDVDRLMLELLERPVVAKIKDASKGRSFKINLYSDDGQRFNRAKVDLDRDDKWDEKWDFDADGSIARKVSSADDDATYDQHFVLEAGARWQPVSE